jgi:hypothetical protein
VVILVPFKPVVLVLGFAERVDIAGFMDLLHSKVKPPSHWIEARRGTRF